MAPGRERRGGPESKDGFEGRDLLVGRPEGAADQPAAVAARTPPAGTSPQPGALALGNHGSSTWPSTSSAAQSFARSGT